MTQELVSLIPQDFSKENIACSEGHREGRQRAKLSAGSWAQREGVRVVQRAQEICGQKVGLNKSGLATGGGFPGQQRLKLLGMKYLVQWFHNYLRGAAAGAGLCIPILHLCLRFWQLVERLGQVSLAVCTGAVLRFCSRCYSCSGTGQGKASVWFLTRSPF